MSLPLDQLDLLGMPADLLIDTGHPAGLRMVERGGFGQPDSPRLALLLGRHEAVLPADQIGRAHV